MIRKKIEICLLPEELNDHMTGQALVNNRVVMTDAK